jgi:hypothetical protein
LSNLKSDVAYREKIRLSWGEVLMGGVVKGCKHGEAQKGWELYYPREGVKNIYF